MLQDAGSPDRSHTVGLGETMALDAAGRIIRDGLPNISAIGVADLAEVVEHRITRIFDSIAHHVRFHGGGELYYVFNRRGQVVELRSRALQLAISDTGDYLFRQSAATASHGSAHPR